jgi:hypothetical protein
VHIVEGSVEITCQARKGQRQQIAARDHCIVMVLSQPTLRRGANGFSQSTPDPVALDGIANPPRDRKPKARSRLHGVCPRLACAIVICTLVVRTRQRLKQKSRATYERALMPKLQKIPSLEPFCHGSRSGLSAVLLSGMPSQ